MIGCNKTWDCVSIEPKEWTISKFFVWKKLKQSSLENRHPEVVLVILWRNLRAGVGNRWVEVVLSLPVWVDHLRKYNGSVGAFWLTRSFNWSFRLILSRYWSSPRRDKASFSVFLQNKFCCGTLDVNSFSCSVYCYSMFDNKLDQLLSSLNQNWVT